METSGRVLLGAMAAIIVHHWLNGGTRDVTAWLNYVFTGRGAGVQSRTSTSAAASTEPMPVATTTPVPARPAARPSTTTPSMPTVPEGFDEETWGEA